MTDSEPSDYELVDLALSGDQGAFAALTDRYGPSVLGVVFRMVHNREDAEDIVQESFVKAFNALESFNKKFSFSTWLYKIATNHSIDYLRKKRLKLSSIDARIQTKDGEVRRQIPDSTHNPEDHLLAHEVRTSVEKAIKALPEKYRAVIILRHTQEKSYEEIADILSLPMGTIKARIFRAREMLKITLRRKGYRT